MMGDGPWHSMGLFALVCSVGEASTGRTIAAPQSEELLHITTDLQTERYERQPRAMYFTKTPQSQQPENVTQKELKISTPVNVTATTETIQWTPVNATDNVTLENVASINTTITTDNVTEAQNTTFTKRRNLTRPESGRAVFMKDDIPIEGLSESRIVTEKPLSLETAFVQTKIPANIESSRRVIDPEGGMDTGVIAGISFAALALAGLAGSTAFILYRRRYLNKPQTLNDKCSNPDSSGYLDDSTIRDNSEEMYSLDNDSFLNSLEAMTIQNYWTDTVKHTKL
ncbi:unnamed protein product [Pieris macdunnoughi]|uniref:Uncharacterized protein n=1 Tax=Pieris macdunnoughi TaxID=345717 RepID=A0A821TMQ2_9NEOP|nr:unnamed protein product [Pieris macdunnoughi]